MNRVMLMSGGTGFLMSRLARRFLEEGHRVIFLTRQSDQSPEERMRWQLGDFKNDQWRVIAGDITKPLWGIKKDDLYTLKKEVTEIWHGAALVSFDGRKKELAQATNVEGTRNALALAEYFYVPLHYISTAYIGREDNQKRVGEAPVCRAYFRNIYEETKCGAEILVNQWQKEGKGKAVVYRPAILIGDSRTGEAQSFTGYYVPAKFLAAFKKQNSFLVVPYVKKATLNLIPVDWAVEMIDEISRHTTANGKIFHITHPNPPTIHFLFSHGFTYFGITRFFFLPLSPRLLSLLVRLTNTMLMIAPFYWAKRIRMQFLQFAPYFSGEPRFLQENVEAVLGRKVMFPSIDKKILDRCLDYAVSHDFDIISQ